MSLQNGRASPREDVVDSRHTVGTCSRQLVASLVEAGIKHLIVVPTELFNALTGSHVPKTRCSVDGACQAIIASEIELAAGELCRMSIKREKTLSCAHIPDLGRVIEGCCH